MSVYPLIYLFCIALQKDDETHRLALSDHKKRCSASHPKFSSQSKVSFPQTGAFCGWKQHSETSFRPAAEIKGKMVENWVIPKREEQHEGREGIHHIPTYTPETANVAPSASAVHAGWAG